MNLPTHCPTGSQQRNVPSAEMYKSLSHFILFGRATYTFGLPTFSLFLPPVTVKNIAMLGGYEYKAPQLQLQQNTIHIFFSLLSGRELWVLALGADAHRHVRLRPEVKYVGNMHGNEVNACHKSVNFHLFSQIQRKLLSLVNTSNRVFGSFSNNTSWHRKLLLLYQKKFEQFLASVCFQNHSEIPLCSWPPSLETCPHHAKHSAQHFTQINQSELSDAS